MGEIKYLSIKCSALRGLAIMLIMLHNYCHWLPFAVPENEFSFSVEKYIQFWNVISWDTIFIQFFSFWGHLGVSVFVFLSGYGLVKKYDDTIINWKSFIIMHYKKLCIPMVLGFIAYYFVLYIINHPNNQDIFTIVPIKRFFAQITLIINFLPNPHRLIMPGPYWYFGLTMQLYIIYLLFVYKRPISYITAIALCAFIFSLFLEYNPQLLISIKYNFFGWLFPFIYGIICYRGFCIGYTSSTIIGVLGVNKGSILLATSLLPQNIIFIPCMLALGVSGLKLYRSIIKDRRKENIKIEMYRHTILCLIMLVGLIVSSLLETYISSTLFVYIINYL